LAGNSKRQAITPFFDFTFDYHCSEVGELVEIFQWLSEEQSRNLQVDELDKAVKEIADVQIYLIRLADKLNINIEQAVKDKIIENEKKYPADKVKGSSKKYTDYK